MLTVFKVTTASCKAEQLHLVVSSKYAVHNTHDSLKSSTQKIAGYFMSPVSSSASTL